MGGWKARLRTSLCAAYRYGGAMRLHEAIARCLGQEFVTVLLFHRVTDAIPEDGLTVGSQRFRRICRLLAERFRVVPLGEIFRLLRSGGPLPRRTVAITFDDCYRDNLDAAGVLKGFGLPATFFVPTGFVGTCRPFDWDRHLPPLPNLTWEQVRQMADMGFEIGSHTVSHADMGAVPPEQARHELVASRQTIEEKIGRPCRWFAYPFGGRNNFRPEYLPLIREAGYEGAVSAFGGFVTRLCDDRMLPREAVPYFHSMPHLEMHLSGCLHWLYALRGRLAGPEPFAAPPPAPPSPSARRKTEPAHELFAPVNR
jgi:peptidoglycan/xylan/chitin deacetylase (PgdA/CDA1 family)